MRHLRDHRLLRPNLIDVKELLESITCQHKQTLKFRAEKIRKQMVVHQMFRILQTHRI